jgi:hypothetical protein
MVGKVLNSKMGILYKELFNLYNSGELENINNEEGIILRSLIINLCDNIGSDLGIFFNSNCYEDSEEVNNVYKEYINK